MNLSHIKKHLANHPISYRVAGGSLTFFFVLGFVLTSFGIHGVLTESILKLIDENRAPGTFALLFSVSLLYLSAKVATMGPTFNPQGGLDRLLSVYIPNAALGLGAAYVGITVGAAFAIGIFAYDSLPASFELPKLLLVCVKLLGGLIFTYLLFVFITINRSTAPGYATHQFQRNIRALSMLFFLALLGRSLLAIASAR